MPSALLSQKLLNADSMISEDDRDMMAGAETDNSHGKPSETYSPDILRRFLKVENVGSVMTGSVAANSSEENVAYSSKSSFATRSSGVSVHILPKAKIMPVCKFTRVGPRGLPCPTSAPGSAGMDTNKRKVS